MTNRSEISLADLLDPAHQPKLHVGSDGRVTLTTGSAELTLTDPPADLDALTALGSAASHAYAQYRQVLAREQQKQASAQLRDLQTRWLDELPAKLGMSAAADGRTFIDPAIPGVHVTAGTFEGNQSRSRGPADVIELRVVADTDTEIATVRLREDGSVALRKRFERLPTGSFETDPLLPDDARRLYATNPWRSADVDADVALPTLIRQLLGAAQTVATWIRDVEHGQAEARDARTNADQQAVEWRRKSRSKDRIPTATLTKWMDARSHVEYSADRVPIGGWKIAAVPVRSERRPDILDRRHNPKIRKPVGVKELLYVVRLEHHDPAYRRTPQKIDHMRFHNSDIDDLRAALPACVVSVPEDRTAIFVAYDAPEHVLELHAALAEWILLGDVGS